MGSPKFLQNKRVKTVTNCTQTNGPQHCTHSSAGTLCNIKYTLSLLAPDCNHFIHPFRPFFGGFATRATQVQGVITYRCCRGTNLTCPSAKMTIKFSGAGSVLFLVTASVVQYDSEHSLSSYFGQKSDWYLFTVQPNKLQNQSEVKFFNGWRELR